MAAPGEDPDLARRVRVLTASTPRCWPATSWPACTATTRRLYRGCELLVHVAEFVPLGIEVAGVDLRAWAIRVIQPDLVEVFPALFRSPARRAELSFCQTPSLTTRARCPQMKLPAPPSGFICVHGSAAQENWRRGGRSVACGAARPGSPPGDEVSHGRPKPPFPRRWLCALSTTPWVDARKGSPRRRQASRFG